METEYLKNVEHTDGHGGFTAAGVGFLYVYEPERNVITMSNASGTYARELKPPTRDPEEVFRYTELLEKSTQVKALKLSNNTTINLLDLLRDEEKGGENG